MGIACSGDDARARSRRRAYDKRSAPHGRRGGERSDDGRPETRLQRLDRNLEEMTGELRVVVTGVQVLFAFLLIVPFNAGFAGVGPFERAVYFVTLLCSALAALCTIAPAAYHRVLFRSDDKRHVVFFANRVVLVGWCSSRWRCAARCCS